MKSKRGAMEIEEIVKLILAITIFIILVSGVILLLSGRGSELLASIKETMRFGR